MATMVTKSAVKSVFPCLMGMYSPVCMEDAPCVADGSAMEKKPGQALRLSKKCSNFAPAIKNHISSLQ